MFPALTPHELNKRVVQLRFLAVALLLTGVVKSCVFAGRFTEISLPSPVPLSQPCLWLHLLRWPSGKKKTRLSDYSQGFLDSTSQLLELSKEKSSLSCSQSHLCLTSAGFSQKLHICKKKNQISNAQGKIVVSTSWKVTGEASNPQHEEISRCYYYYFELKYRFQVNHHTYRRSHRQTLPLLTSFLYSTHTQSHTHSKNPWRQLPCLLSNPDFKEQSGVSEALKLLIFHHNLLLSVPQIQLSLAQMVSAKKGLVF